MLCGHYFMVAWFLLPWALTVSRWWFQWGRKRCLPLPAIFPQPKPRPATHLGSRSLPQPHAKMEHCLSSVNGSLTRGGVFYSSGCPRTVLYGRDVCGLVSRLSHSTGTGVQAGSRLYRAPPRYLTVCPYHREYTHTCTCMLSIKLTE